MRILVSCASQRTIFHRSVKKICDESNDEYTFHFIPTEAATPAEENMLGRMIDEINRAHLILMDATPESGTIDGKENFVTNPGVLIEYGAIVSVPNLKEKLVLFCKSGTRRTLHPYLQRKTANDYSEDITLDPSNPDSLEGKLKAVITKYRDEAPERDRKRAERLHDAMSFVSGLHREGSSGSL